MNIEYKYIERNSDKLLIVYQGALLKSYTKYQFQSEKYHAEINKLRERYYYYKQFENVEYNVLYLKDNMNDLMGWYTFDNEKIVVDEYVSQLESFFKKHNFKPENIIAFGSSKGGYGALMHAFHSDYLNNVAVTVPQIDLKLYLETGIFPKSLSKYINNSYKDIDPTLLDNLLVNSAKNMKNSQNKQILIVTGKGDEQYPQTVELYELLKEKTKIQLAEITDVNVVHTYLSAKTVRFQIKAIEDFFNTGKLATTAGEYIGNLKYNKTSPEPMAKQRHTLEWVSKRNIGIICDSEYYLRYKDVGNLTYITYENIDEHIDNLEYVVYITAWKGMHKEIQSNLRMNYTRSFLGKIKYLNSNLPVIFISKEDPPNFQRFSPEAIYADYIYTSSVTMKNEYRNIIRSNNIDTFRYGINPYLTNPIDTFNEQDIVHFAGSFLSETYPERFEDQKRIFDDVIKVTENFIFRNRNLIVKENVRSRYEIDEKYKQFEQPAIEFKQLLEEQKQYKTHINLNSVKDDPTMSAVRPYDLQAMGKQIVSNHSVALSNTFPNINFHNFSGEYEILKKSPCEIEKEQRLAGIRAVFSDYLAPNIFMDIENKLFNENNKLDYNLFVVADDDDPFTNQTIRDFTIVANESDIPNSKGLNLVTKYNPNYQYQPTYLEDLINGFKYTTADRVQIGDDLEFNYTSSVASDDLSMWVQNKSGQIFNIQSNLLIESDKTTYTPKFSVIIPVYNNGLYLQSRAFKSLKTTPSFKNMEIIIIDDGSDSYTVEVINKLALENANVKTFFFPHGGSGSASRPRNKGLTLASTNFITYLDPDNEQVLDGYQQLYEILENSDYDFVQGSHSTHGKRENLGPKLVLDDFENIVGIDKLVNDDFIARSMQAAMFKRSFLVENNIQLLEGAIGQDTLFYYQVMAASNNVKMINQVIHKYYNCREDSVVNTISIDSLHGQLVLEKAKHKFLIEADLLDDYVKSRLETYYELIVIKRLSQVDISRADELYQLYKAFVDIYGIDRFSSVQITKLYLSQSVDEFIKELYTGELISASKNLEIANAKVEKLEMQLEKQKNISFKTRVKKGLKRRLRKVLKK